MMRKAKPLATRCEVEERRYFMDQLWDRARARARAKPETGDASSYESLLRTEWSNGFEQMMRARLVMGALRYGLMGFPAKPQYDRVTAAMTRLLAYQEDGNLERLADAANLCLLEFVEGDHPRRHLAAADDGVHVHRRGT